MERNQNYVELWGVAAGEPVFSHENHTRRFDKFPCGSSACQARTTCPSSWRARHCCASALWRRDRAFASSGSCARLTTRAGRQPARHHRVRQSIEPGDGSYFNRILLSGALCKKPVLRRTPLGRSICDVILAVNRHYGRADYLPCIAWGQTAVQIAGMDVGERLALEGRVQSRTYTKLLESGSEERTAFEVSIMQLLDEEETEETALL